MNCKFGALAAALITGLVIQAPQIWAGEGEWGSDYRAALAQASENGKFVLIWFFDPQKPAASELFAESVLSEPAILQLSAKHVLLKLPVDARIATALKEPKEIILLDHPAFAEMLHQPGIAMLDMSDETSPHFHHVVSVFPFAKGCITRDEFAVMLELPRGSLTQRTLIWAVRTHAEKPQSAAREASPLLMAEAASHAAQQARINSQGHHDWENRFHSINARMGNGLVAREVCAESWPGQNLVEAAQECVHSWRQSSGHWEAVSARHELFGYDLQRGTSGIWYAAGIFGCK